MLGTAVACFVCSISLLSAIAEHLDVENEQPFRMYKVNQLWQKAKKRYGDDRHKMEDLFADLKIHDKMLGAHKKKKAHGYDDDGLKEADLEEKLLVILKKHGLGSMADQNFVTVLDNETTKPRAQLRDPKLLRLWNKAEKAGFSVEEMEILREEFQHQQTKLNEYNELKSNVDQYHEAKKNEVSPEKHDEFAEQEIKLREKQLKTTHRELKQNLKRLKTLSTGVKDVGEEFLDRRVHDLWLQAQKTNMTVEELMSFKDELKHFENRIEKHKYFEKQLELSKQSLIGQTDDDVLPEKHLHLEKKTFEYGHKVKKIQNDLKKKINEVEKRHTEL